MFQFERITSWLVSIIENLKYPGDEEDILRGLSGVTGNCPFLEGLGLTTARYPTFEEENYV